MTMHPMSLELTQVKAPMLGDAASTLGRSAKDPLPVIPTSLKKSKKNDNSVSKTKKLLGNNRGMSAGSQDLEKNGKVIHTVKPRNEAMRKLSKYSANQLKNHKLVL